MFYEKWNKPIVGAVIILNLVAVYFILGLEFRYDIRSFFPKGNQDLEFFYEHTDEFGSDEQLLIVAFQNDPSIFDSSFLVRLDTFSRFLLNSNQVEKVQSITSYRDHIKGPFGIFSFPVVRPEKPDSYSSDSLALLERHNLMGWLFARDFKTTSITAILKSDLEDKEKVHLIDTIHYHAQLLDLPIPKMGGQVFTEVNYIRMLVKESLKSITIAFIIIIILLILIFRSFMGILIPAISVVIGLLLLYGYLGMVGRNLNILSTLFPTLMSVVGMSDLIHIFSNYQDLLRKGKSKKDALSLTVKEKGMAIFLTSITTAIGFLSLTISSMSPIRHYGIDGAVGVIIAFLLAITFTPSLLSLIPQPVLIKRKSRLLNWESFFKSIHTFVTTRPVRILSFFGILSIICFIGISKISTNHIFSDFASDHTKYSQDIKFINTELSGARVFDLALFFENDHNIKEKVVLKEIEKLHDYLKARPEFGAVFSPVSLFKSANQTFNNGRSDAYQLPEQASHISNHIKHLKQRAKTLYARFINTSGTAGRLYASFPDMGRLDVAELNDEISAWIKAEINPDILQTRYTGSALLLDKQNEQLIKSLLISLSIAFLAVSIIMILLFRNFRLVLISLIPNMIPLVMVAALLGFLQIPLSSAISLIFTLGFVIAVDDSIHFLTKFRWEMGQGMSKTEALMNTFIGAGKPIILTSVILAAGYAAIVVSYFKETFYHGVLISITMVFALVADLFLLPALITLFFPEKISKKE